MCYECHDDLQQAIAKAPFKHDPAGNGECSSCHNAHQSSEKALLLKAPGKLCFDCHEEKDMAAVKAHAGTAGKSCVECHDPHSGKDKYLLKGAAAKAAGK
jgi:predicted CXXCH cytochrome family protein